MTEPDPVAALAAQLEVLRRQLAAYTGETGHLRALLDRDSSQVLMLRLQVKQLGREARRGDRQAPGSRPASAVLAGAERGGARGAARRGSRLGGACRLRSVARLHDQAGAVLGEPPGSGLGAVEPDGGVDPGVRRPGQPPAAGCPVVLRALASRRAVPPQHVSQVRCRRVPAAARAAPRPAPSARHSSISAPASSETSGA